MTCSQSYFESLIFFFLKNEKFSKSIILECSHLLLSLDVVQGQKYRALGENTYYWYNKIHIFMMSISKHKVWVYFILKSILKFEYGMF